MRRHPLDRFYEKTQPASKVSGSGVDTFCLEWASHKTGTGYGRFFADGKAQAAHRWIFQYQTGPIPKGLEVRHRCDNPCCVRMDHLELGTRQDNMSDMVQRGRRASTKGSKNGRAKLTGDQVREIRQHLAEGGLSQREIAQAYGISQGVVNSIKKGRSWGWLK